eukprot:CAMPEP_0119368992 /NCGR_PEP_ID=MMETSP1334-20130426/15580_1 /TAXON_ID=127549 /ORGANISM="Calcidiscus leptoporus, Strain RCC1130" /LENGTH=59 /DNA_ID=CAMNT_0007385747 /DNA_START=137 /DNA_END=312 /DNA_ORIENTATION=+
MAWGTDQPRTRIEEQLLRDSTRSIQQRVPFLIEALTQRLVTSAWMPSVPAASRCARAAR